VFTFTQRIDNAVSFIRTKTASSPKIGLILGSGLGEFTAKLDNSVSINFQDIPEFPVSTIEGHEGAFVFGNYDGTPLVAIRGRLHYYEGYDQKEITMPVRVMKRLGVETLILTNAAGGINLDFSEGALMLITDHINLSGANPLVGANLDEYGPRFPDVSDIYTKELRNKLKEAALREGITLAEGVYIMYSGPNYETPAEIRSYRLMGADAVGMSTAPEALVAAHCGMRVIGISCITNMAAGVQDITLSHQDVLEAANRIKQDFTKLLCIAINIAYSD